MFYSESPLVILSKVKDHFCGRLAILKVDSLAVQLQKLDSNILKNSAVRRVRKIFNKGMLTV